MPRAAGHAAAGEGIKNKVPWVGQHADEESGKTNWKARGMLGKLVLATIALIHAIALSVCKSDKIRRDRSPIIYRKLLTDVMSARSQLGAIAIFEQSLHGFAVGG